jgi:SAM-dependent methyltransferase
VNSSLFPELGEAPGFPRPDIVANLDADRLASLADESQDFVIASHVLEHLANPIAMLLECFRVLRPEGLLVLLIPDRHKTFDRERSPTPLAHLIDEYRRDVREVDDAHILDFMVGTSRTLGDTRDTSLFSSELMAAEIALHRQRSIHAHVWNLREFDELLTYVTNELGLRWDVVDTMPPGAEGTHGDEFGWVLARPKVDPVRKKRRRFSFLQTGRTG